MSIKTNCIIYIVFIYNFLDFVISVWTDYEESCVIFFCQVFMNCELQNSMHLFNEILSSNANKKIIFLNKYKIYLCGIMNF